MKNLIYINACMRAGSRTRRIATPIIEELRKRYNVETVDLTKNLYPVADNYTLEDRNQGIVPPEHNALAKRIAADLGLQCINLKEVFNDSSYCIDGVHPQRKGTRMIAEHIFKEL